MRSVLILATVVLALGTAFAAELPMQLRICKPDVSKPCVIYQVFLRDTLVHGDNVGWADGYQHKIEISTKGQKPRDVASTLMHEAMHAVFYENGFQNPDTRLETQHSFIYHLENGLTRLLHDNPELIHYLQGAY